MRRKEDEHVVGSRPESDLLVATDKPLSPRIERHPEKLADCTAYTRVRGGFGVNSSSVRAHFVTQLVVRRYNCRPRAAFDCTRVVAAVRL